jgi:hypothetical protein
MINASVENVEIASRTVEGAWYSKQGCNTDKNANQTRGQDVGPKQGEVLQIWKQRLRKTGLKQVVDVDKSRGAEKWQALAAAEESSLIMVACKEQFPVPLCVIRRRRGCMMAPIRSE